MRIEEDYYYYEVITTTGRHSDYDEYVVTSSRWVEIEPSDLVTADEIWQFAEEQGGFWEADGRLWVKFPGKRQAWLLSKVRLARLASLGWIPQLQG